ncbi:hypothetical protein MAQ5080_01474 [Marinomonas aquimarina]|uniref:Uncharacterized protein n=1 Tax=Marinomonas aquimarina TaxID=295068 RepID=A0A1A8TAS8_9GAMM|nr:hypothetical protein [Marinomonas aquimarina]SBS29694.1 hypothetical protein MAQ5080_01474 [Marinomonas aquimarina]
MSFFARPYVLIWRDNAWLALSKQQYFQNQDDQSAAPAESPDCSLDEALQQLASFLRQRKRKPSAILLPDAWLEISQCDLDQDLPQSLHLLAAHTQAGQMSVRESLPPMISYVTHHKQHAAMHVATLAKTYFDAFTQLGITKLYSEGLIWRSQLSSWRQLSSAMQSFVSYEDDYLERQTEHRYRCTLVALIVLVALSSGWLAAHLIKQTPEPMSAFQWPWPSVDTERMEMMDSLRYLRTLPASVRLDDVRVSQSRIRLSVTGNAADVVLWQANWPEQLPPLLIMLNGEGPI